MSLSARSRKGWRVSNMPAAHLSNSQFGDYSRCGKSYQLKRLQGTPSIPAVWLIGGKAVHLAIEEYNRQSLTESEQA